jgi:multidrug efflux system membrane fusion protein
MPEPTQLEPAFATDSKPKHSPLSGEEPAEPQGSRLRQILILLVLAAVVALVVWRIQTSKKDAQSEADRTAAQARRPIPVQVSLVQQRTVPIFLTALGTVTAYNTVTVNARVSGQLLHVNFREGQTVHKGQLLMEIDPAPYKAALDQAIGQLAKDEANQKNTAGRVPALHRAL